MKAAVCYEFGKPLVIEDVKLASPRRDQVKIRLVATAICHSDIHDMKGELPGPLPFIGGHESAGYVEETGPDVKSVAPGDPVLVTLLSSCGRCYYCLRGSPHLCQNMFNRDPETILTNSRGQAIDQKAGVAGFAEYVLVKESQTCKIPADMPMDRAALLSCGVMTGFGAVVNRAKVPALSSVVVIGAGGVGLNSIQAAALCGAYPVIAVDVVESKMKAAMSFGATHTINARDSDAADTVRKLTNERGADYVFVTVGSAAAIKQGFAMAGSRGTTVIVGLPPVTETFTFSAFDFVTSERVLTGGFMGSTNIQVDIPRLIELYKAGHLKLDELITARYSLDEINDAVESTIKGEALRNIIMFPEKT